MTTVRVLLVEDEILVRMLTAEVLRDEGFEVVEAATGDEAATLLDKAGTFDVVLTDVQMPGKLDGVDLAVRARFQQPMIPVLIVSGYAIQLMDRLSGLQPPAVFITKPYRLKDVVDTLLRLTMKL